MKMILTIMCLLAATWARATLTVSQTFSPGVTIPAGNPVGVAAAGNFTAASAGDHVLGITVGLNISGGYNGSLYAYLVAPNGTLVTLMNQPGVSVDWFGAESSGMNITLSDTGGTSIQNVTGGYGTLLTGTYQADQTLGTFNNSLANGTWGIYFASQESGGGDAVLNSFTLNIRVIPEPANVALVIFLAVLLGWTGFRRAVRCGAATPPSQRVPATPSSLTPAAQPNGMFGLSRDGASQLHVAATALLSEDSQAGCRSGPGSLTFSKRRGKQLLFFRQ